MPACDPASDSDSGYHRGMRKVLYAITIAGLLTAGCGEKKHEGAGKTGSAGSATTASTGSAAGSSTGSATGSAAGSAATGSSTGSAATGSAAGSGSAAPAAKDDGVAEMGTGSDGRSLYYARALTEADLAGRTLRDLALMRNTVYARAGHTFRKAWLRDHFTAMPWYQAQPQDDASKITAVDRANVKRIADHENAVPHDELTARRTTLQAMASPSEADEVELRLLNEQLGGTGGKPAGGQAKVSPLEDPTQLDRLLTLDDLADLSQRDLRILRNTVYARHGREFKSDTLIAWFSDKDWYKPDPAFTESMLSAIDRKNVKLIRSVEDSLGGPMSEHDQKAEEGWFDGA